jgi:hypothetical protein
MHDLDVHSSQKIKNDNNEPCEGIEPWSKITLPIATRGVSPVALPYTLTSILRQKKNYGNLNISPCKIIIFKKNPLKETKILQDIITL